MYNKDNEERIKTILLTHQSLMSLDKGQSVQITSMNRGGNSVREFKRIK